MRTRCCRGRHANESIGPGVVGQVSARSVEVVMAVVRA
ncbi:hypothetical protein BZL30_7002 [Mycobacterium kansasii]|uniref:Uncharacterized protein n=1 Tax=Mycobacterium kansasii TaxID=1768 RepID=A0A1V3WQ00_MYCKA|nr:hypothetical protein BZL30_7002 [Mycobacterium kansasii]